MSTFEKDRQYYKFCAYGFLKNLRFFDAFIMLFFLEVGLSYSEIGILYAIREIVVNVSEIPSGIIADTYGRKSSLLTAFLFYILSFLLFYFSNDFWLLAGAMIFYGIGDAFRSGTNKGMIMDYLRRKGWSDEKVDYYGHTRSWSQKGSALSALLAGVLVLYTGSYRSIFLWSIVPYVANLINVFTYPSHINHSSKKKEKRKAMGVMNEVRQIIKFPSVFTVMNSAALHTSFLKAMKDYIQPIMVQVAILIPFGMDWIPKQKSGLVIGILYFIIFLLTSRASKSAGKLLKFGIVRVSRLTLLIGLGIGMISGLLIWQKQWILAIIFFVGIYLVENLRKPIMTGLLSDQVPNEILTSVLSIQSFYSTILTSIIAIAMGIVADTYGLGIGLVALTFILFLSLVIGQIKDKEKSLF